MATSMNKNSQQQQSNVGLLLIFGDIISNEQREEIFTYLKQALKSIDKKYNEVNEIFNDLIHENEFQADSQYRQLANTEHGSFAGFLYLPSFHTLSNVLTDFFNACYHVCMIFCGQQLDSNGSLVLSDSVFTCDHFHNLFEDNSPYLIRDLHLILPFVSNQWTKLFNNYLQKHLENVQITDLSSEINANNSFGEIFYKRLNDILHKETVNFDIYTKLKSRDSSGTIAFDEPNLYILYGQQGEASLFGIRGFVVLVNGGFSRLPSYWNLIRGLQNIDACILTHYDYDVFPGLQTILHRKTILSPYDDRLCKPDIGAIFLNHLQQTKIQSLSLPKAISNKKLLINLNENIDQFLNDVKQLNIDTFDLIKHTSANKPTIEPINLYKKIAFGSLDLYVLHPTASMTEDDKALSILQKTPIRDQQPSSSIIPLHHWYSSCSLLVWTPSSKSSKDSLVRILYTGVCPQTVVFEALGRVRHLEFLRESQQQTIRASNTKTTTSSTNISIGVKNPPQKPKVSPSVTNGETSSRVHNTTTKVPPRPVASKPKVSPTTVIKQDKPRSAPIAKKTPAPTAGGSGRIVNKDKKTPNPRTPTTKRVTPAKQANNQEQKLKKHNDHEQKLKAQKESEPNLEIHNGHEHKLEVRDGQEQKAEVQNGHEQELEAQNESEPNLETHNGHEHKLEAQDDQEEKSKVQNGHEQELEIVSEPELHLETHNGHEHKIELQDDQEEKSEAQNGHEEELEIIDEPEQNREIQDDHEEKLEIENKSEPESVAENEHEQKPETEIDQEQNLEAQNDELHQSDNDKEEQSKESNEHEISADELNENPEPSTNNHEDDEIQRPESVALTNNLNESFFESNAASPIDETKSSIGPVDPMTTSFVDGVPNTQNPFSEKTNDDNDDEEMEIIHHDISTSNTHPMPSIDEINPQGLPVAHEVRPKKSPLKKLSNGNNRTNGPSTSSNNTNQASSHKSKQTPPSGSIFHVDVAYIPCHGNEHYVDSEFFRRIRARYYILNAVQINRLTLESLIDGKQQWEEKQHVPVTLVPTFDGDQLRQFFVMNKNRLAELNINILPAATRCNVQYDDEGSPAQRLRFSSINNTDEQ